MNQKLEYLYNNLENSRRDLINELIDKDPKQLSISPAPGKWSVSQVFYHLNKAESLSMVYVSKKMLDVNNLKTTGIKESLKLAGLGLLFNSPLKFKVPVEALGETPDNIDYTDIVNQWNDTRVKLKSFLDSLPEDILRKNVFKQPAIGRQNIYQMVEFMQMHFNRHRMQVNRIVYPVVIRKS
jgi:hypothetical protein